MHAAALAFGTIFLFTWATPDAARAEGFVDIYLGGAGTQDADSTLTVGPAPGLPQRASSGPVEFEPGVSVGIRGGYWLDSVSWLGLALSAAYFDLNEDTALPPPFPSLTRPVKLDVFPISALLMLRYPLLKGSDYPRGRLQPYTGVGVGAFVTTAKIKLKPIGAPENFTDTNVSVGVNVVAGVKFHFTTPELAGKSIAIFVEYGFTHFKPSDFKDNVGGVPFEVGADRFDTHHGVLGVAFHF